MAVALRIRRAHSPGERSDGARWHMHWASYAGHGGDAHEPARLSGTGMPTPRSFAGEVDRDRLAGNLPPVVAEKIKEPTDIELLTGAV